MLRRLNKRIKGQNTAEYAILIGLVIAAAIGMQMYAKRALQARVHAGSRWMVNETSTNLGITPTYQYEPYYLTSAYNVARDVDAASALNPAGEFNSASTSITQRDDTGYQTFGAVNQE